MDITLYIVTSLVGAGWYLNKNGKQPRAKYTTRNNILNEEIPVGDNIYNSNRSIEVRNYEQDLSNKNYEKSKNPKKTNMVPLVRDLSDSSIPIDKPIVLDTKIRNKPEEAWEPKRDMPWKKGYKEPKKQPVENDGVKYTKEFENELEQKKVNNMGFLGEDDDAYAKWNETIETAPRKYRDSGGWQNIEVQENFTHNNMVPFFGGSIKQNVEPMATSSHMEYFTGRGDTYRSKEEVNSMFTPAERANSGVPFGSNTNLSNSRDYYNVSKYQQGIPLMEPERVGHGLAIGPDQSASGGFHDTYRPTYKNVNQLRVKTNQKVSFEGRKGPGVSNVKSRGIQQEVFVNRPKTVTERKRDDWLRTTGAFTKPEYKGEVVLKNTQRKESIVQRGPASYQQGNKIRSLKEQPQLMQPKRQELGTYGTRHVNATTSNMKQNDMGRSSMRNVVTNRSTMSTKVHNSNVANYNQTTVHYDDNAKFTKKTETEINNRQTGNFNSSSQFSQSIRPQQELRKTTKQTTLYCNSGNINQPAGMIKRQVDIQDKIKCTKRQVTSNFEYQGPAKTAAGGDKMENRQAAKNMVQKDTRECTLKGRAPTKSNVKVSNGSDKINVSIKKEDCDRNNPISVNEMQGLLIPGGRRGNIGCVSDSGKRGNESDRIDDVLVQQHKKNPYTQSLHSY